MPIQPIGIDILLGMQMKWRLPSALTRTSGSIQHPLCARFLSKSFIISFSILILHCQRAFPEISIELRQIKVMPWYLNTESFCPQKWMHLNWNLLCIIAIRFIHCTLYNKFMDHAIVLEWFVSTNGGQPIVVPCWFSVSFSCLRWFVYVLLDKICEIHKYIKFN